MKVSWFCSILLVTLGMGFIGSQAVRANETVVASFAASNTMPTIKPSSTSNEAWDKIVSDAKGQTVYFHAWGGDPQINAYIQWLAEKVNNKYQVELVHVKLTDTSEAVSRVLAEKSANNLTKGKVDLIWINGQNFASMANNNLLEADWTFSLPNFLLTDPNNNPAMTRDFGLPTQGMEAPWGKAALTFYYNTQFVQSPPSSLINLVEWVKNNKGRFTYSKPPDFLGTSFLKYLLIVANKHQKENVFSGLYQAPTAQSKQQLLGPLWDILDEIHPYLWRKGRYFVEKGLSLRRLVGDGELSLSFTFSASDVPAAVDRYDLPTSIRSYAMSDGSLSNVHFVALPFNASHKAGAKVVANFLLSPEAQAQKQRSEVWGDSTVLSMQQLNDLEKKKFSTNKLHPSALPLEINSVALGEPHPEWINIISRQWLIRYGDQ